MEMDNALDFISAISGISAVFTFFSLIFGGIILVIVTQMLIGWVRDMQHARRVALTKESLKTLSPEEIETYDKATCLRYICAPDGVDPNQNNTLVINDGGKDTFIRTFTIANLPKRVRFASTFSELLNFENCSSSIFVEPIADNAIANIMDRHIITLESEFIGASKRGDTNRKRKIKGQYQETEAWAENSEAGEATFFYVGFLFSLMADSFEELNRLSDEFHAKALTHRIDVVSCFATQAEAFLSNAPYNRRFSLEAGPIRTDCVQTFIFDHKSLSTVYNYTQSEFNHKEGVFLGRNMDTQKPICFDIYDGTHDGFTLLICGKTGCGKSLTVKALAYRYIPFDFHFVGIDSQARGTVGEYAGIAELVNGVNFLIKADTNNVMNIFELSESNVLATDGVSGHEMRTLELNEKVVQASNTILTMIQDGTKNLDNQTQLMTYIKRIVMDTTTELYTDRGIFHGDPDSLYTTGTVVSNHELTSGRVKKLLPTMTDFYVKVLMSERDNQKEELSEAFSIILYSLKDFIKELIYSEKSITRFTKEQYDALPIDENRAKYWMNPFGEKELVDWIHGVRSYFDGQSTIAISRDCNFTNIDISQLSEAERVIARQIAFDFVNESYIKKNSQNLSLANKLCVILDEAHENFGLEFARKTIDNIVRTARKRNVSIWLSTQSLAEYNRYEETKSILRNAAVKMVYKQDYQDREYIMKTLNLTDSQVDRILSLGGDPSDKTGKNARRGETCIIDNNKVAFCKVDYLKKTEALACETNAEEVRKLFTA